MIETFKGNAQILSCGNAMKAEPELDEKTIREIIVAREQVRRGETIPLEKLERSLEE
jgi:hypothetical protein